MGSEDIGITIQLGTVINIALLVTSLFHNLIMILYNVLQAM